MSRDQQIPSKALTSTDDSAKQLVIDALGGVNTRGFDVDSLYRTRDGYRVIEMLKCDTVPPNRSHPNHYWYKNKTKFLSLFELAEDLGGRLYLVNYSVPYTEFKVIRVKEVDFDTGITSAETRLYANLDEFSAWFKAMNATAKPPIRYRQDPTISAA